MTDQKAQEKQPIYKKWWFWVIIVVVLIGIGGAGASSNKDAQKVGEGESSESAGTGEKSENKENQTFKVGDVISIDDRGITVEKVQRNWSGEYSKPSDGKEYVMITVKIENKSDDKISYNSSEWKMEDSEGAIESTKFVMNNDDALNYGDLAAGGKKSGTLVFEVPKGDQNLKVHYQPNMFIDREAVIELQ